MRSIKAGLVMATVLVLSTGRPSEAQDHEVQGASEAHADSAAHGGQEHESGAHSHKNDLGIFAGATRNDLHETVSFTLGLDYVRKFGPEGEWGIGLVPEYVFADEPEFVFIVPLYRLFGSFYVRAGPGVGLLFENEGEGGEHAGAISKNLDDDPDDSGLEEGGEVQSTLLMRVGIGYGFVNPNGLLLTPSFDLDFGGHRNWFAVFGVTLAKGF